MSTRRQFLDQIVGSGALAAVAQEPQRRAVNSFAPDSRRSGSASSDVLMGFVGDVLVNRDRPDEVFSEVQQILKVPDILFGNLEGTYTDGPQPVPNASMVVGGPANNLEVYARSGFDVMSMANNHIVDAGYEAMLENRTRLKAQGIQTCGAGNSLAEAREPAIVEAGGLRVAFLAYASIFPMGYEARSDRPGVAPMRAETIWRDPLPGYYHAGELATVMTVADPTDIANLAEDIQSARKRADLVATSFHWGDFTRPFHLTDHEKRTAKYCIDQGADMVIGHHHHALRGMEWYQGKPIFYGLGHFVFDLPLPDKEEFNKPEAELGYSVGRREGWPLLPFHEDTRLTLIAWATLGRGGVRDIGFLPCALARDGRVHPLKVGSSAGRHVVNYMQMCNQTQGLHSRIRAAPAVTLAGFSSVRIIPT